MLVLVRLGDAAPPPTQQPGAGAASRSGSPGALLVQYVLVGSRARFGPSVEPVCGDGGKCEDGPWWFVCL